MSPKDSRGNIPLQEPCKKRRKKSTHCRKPSGRISSRDDRDLQLSRRWKCCNFCRSTSVTRGCAPVGCSVGGCGEEEGVIERIQRVIFPVELTALEHKWILRIPHILGNPHGACRRIKCFDGELGDFLRFGHSVRRAHVYRQDKIKDMGIMEQVLEFYIYIYT